MIKRGTYSIKSVEGFKDEFEINLSTLKRTLSKVKKTHPGPRPRQWSKPLLVLMVRHVVDGLSDAGSVSTITITSEKGFLQDVDI